MRQHSPAVTVDLYVSCWNNCDILPFFFRHYDPLVRHYYVYDDGSTDGSLELLAAHPRVQICELPRADPSQSRTLVTLSPAETCWREPSADADWVIICDIDEHLFHPDLAAYLAWCQSQGITIVPVLGFQMLSDRLPADGRLCDQVTRGAPWEKMSKLSLFQPAAIERLNFSPGRHRAAPAGTIVAPDRDEVLLMHFKYLDFERVMRRNGAASERLQAADARPGWGHRWRFTRDQLAADWAAFDAKAVDVRAAQEPWDSHREPRWWTDYRKAAVEGSPSAPHYTSA